MLIKIKNIEWDFGETEGLSLPVEDTIAVDSIDFNAMTHDEQEDEIANYLSDVYGFCINKFSFEKI